MSLSGRYQVAYELHIALSCAHRTKSRTQSSERRDQRHLTQGDGGHSRCVSERALSDPP